MVKSYHLNVLIDEELNNNLIRTAKSMQINKSELARRLLVDGIKKQTDVETAYDSTTVNLESRVKKLEEKEEKSWWKKIIR